MTEKRTISLIPHPIRWMRTTNWPENYDLLRIEITALCLIFSVSILVTIMLGMRELLVWLICIPVLVWIVSFGIKIVNMPLVGELDD